MTARNIITQRNLVKEPQSFPEGTTVATYGSTPTNPTFTIHGQDGSLADTSTPTVAVNRQAGRIDRTETTKVFEENTVKFTSKVLEDKTLLQWAMNEPDGTAGTPDESRTWFYSYLSEGGVEQFVQFLGCKVKECAMSYDLDNYLTIEITMSYKTKIEDTSGPTLGSGSYGTPNTTTPLTHLDANIDPFNYNGINPSIESFSITVTFTMAAQNTIGTIVPLFMKHTQREISGSAVIYKENGIIQADARNATENDITSYIIKSTVLEISLLFSKFKFMPSDEVLKGDDSEATKENKSWEAAGLLVT